MKVSWVLVMSLGIIVGRYIWCSMDRCEVFIMWVVEICICCMFLVVFMIESVVGKNVVMVIIIMMGRLLNFIRMRKSGI